MAVAQVSFGTCARHTPLKIKQPTTTISHPPTFRHSEQMGVAMGKGRYMKGAYSLFKHEHRAQFEKFKRCEKFFRCLELS